MEKWKEDRRATTYINEDYERLVSVIHKTADKIISKNEICRHSKGWWNPELTSLVKQYKKVRRTFAKRSDKANENRLKEVLNNFKEEEQKAKNKYLDPRKPNRFWNVVNRGERGIEKCRSTNLQR